MIRALLDGSRRGQIKGQNREAVGLGESKCSGRRDMKDSSAASGDWCGLAWKKGETATLPASPLLATLYAGGRRLVCGHRRGPPGPERAGDKGAAQRLLQLQQQPLSESGGNIGGAPVPPTREPGVSRAAHPISSGPVDALRRLEASAKYLFNPRELLRNRSPTKDPTACFSEQKHRVASH
jgi:hypothetical protein